MAEEPSARGIGVLCRQKTREVREARLERVAKGMSHRESSPRRPAFAVAVEALGRRRERESLALEERFWRPGQATLEQSVQLLAHLAERAGDIRGLPANLGNLSSELCNPTIGFVVKVHAMVWK
jgi:hypothetical protein